MLKTDLEKLVKEQAAEIEKLKNELAGCKSGDTEFYFEADTVSTTKPRAVDRR